MGFSMGAISAYLQSMLHPDDYAFAAAVSGALDVIDDPATAAIWEGLGYLRDQGYGTALTNPIEWRGLNPRDIAANLTGTGTEVFSSVGDGCPPLKSWAPACTQHPALLNPLAASVETVLANQWRHDSGVLRGAGVIEHRAQLPGIHGANNAQIYRADVVPLANSKFASRFAAPVQFQYRTVATSFGIWGYDVKVHRRQVAFLDMGNARRDARSFVLRGSGSVSVRTPAGDFTPGASYSVASTAAGATTQTQTLTADSDGRLTIQLSLVGANTAVTTVMNRAPSRWAPAIAAERSRRHFTRTSRRTRR
jgi:hypothetical protein